MKQGRTRQSILLPMFTPKELQVCDILLDLHRLFTQPNQHPSPKFPNWAITKRRSTKEPPLAPPLPVPPHHPPHFHLPLQTKLEDKVQASSPATPLSFSPGESDDKPKHSCKKRGREEWIGIIQELTQSGEILKGNEFDEQEVERVRNYYNQLQLHNTELKAWKEKIMLKKEEEIKKMSLKKNGINIVQQLGISAQQQQCFVMNQYHHQHQYGQLFPSSSSAQSSLPLRQPIGPRGIPDLNVSAEEAFGVEAFQPLDHGMITMEDPKEKRLIRRIIRTKKRNEQRCK